MWAVIAVIMFSVALVIKLASVSKGVFFTPETFSIMGFIALSIAHIAPSSNWWPWPHRQ